MSLNKKYCFYFLCVIVNILKVAVLKGESEEVTALSLFSSLLAVGYEDGNIRLFNLESRDSHVTFR